MSCVFVDPAVFMIPTVLERDVWRAFLDRVLVWSLALGSRQFLTSQVALGELMSAGVFPDHAVLKGAIRSLCLQEYNASDFQNALRVLSEREPYAEDRFNISGMVSEASVVPDTIATRLPLSVATALKDVLAGAIRATALQPVNPLPHIGTFDLTIDDDGRAVPAWEVHVCCTVFDGNCSDAADPPQLDGVFGLVQDPAAIQDAWSDVCADPRLATVFMHRRLKSADFTIPELSQIAFSAGFLSSVANMGLNTQGNILQRLYRLCAQVAVGRGMAKGSSTHPVRTSLAAEAPQVTRDDGAKKWRAKLSQTGAGYRLQYWHCPDGGFEFEEVLRESEV